jgi:hypothetical protein
VTVDNPAVIETGGSAQNWQATFTISRTGSTMNGLTVYWSMSGTATLTVDYGLTVSNGSVFIPPGAASTTIHLWTINNANFDCLRFAEMLLTSNANYNIGTPAKAQVDIVDDDSPSCVLPPPPPCNCGGGADLVNQNSGVAANPVSQFGAGPVRAFDGVVKEGMNELSSSGFGVPSYQGVAQAQIL